MLQQQKLAVIEQRIAEDKALNDDDQALMVACAKEALAALVATTADAQE